MPDRRSRARRAAECRTLCQRWQAQVGPGRAEIHQREAIIVQFREMYPEWGFSGADTGRLALAIPVSEGDAPRIPRALHFVAHTITEVREVHDGEHTVVRYIKNADDERTSAHDDAEASWDRRPQGANPQPPIPGRPPLSPESQRLRAALSDLRDTAERVNNVPTIWDRLDDEDDLV